MIMEPVSGRLCKHTRWVQSCLYANEGQSINSLLSPSFAPSPFIVSQWRVCIVYRVSVCIV